MRKELSRRDFLKAAATGLGALAFGGLLSACGEKDSRCDSKHAVTLNKGDHVLVGDYKVELTGYFRQGLGLWGTGGFNEGDYAEFFISNMKDPGNRTLDDYKGPNGIIENLYRYEGRNGIEIGEWLSFGGKWRLVGDNWEKQEDKWAIYRCGHDEFAFWELKDFPGPSPAPTLTPLPKPTQTPPPAAVFP